MKSINSTSVFFFLVRDGNHENDNHDKKEHGFSKRQVLLSLKGMLKKQNKKQKINVGFF